MIRGRVVLVPFPFDDRSALKLRPAVCLSEPAGDFRHVTLAFVTSRVPTDLLPTDLLAEAGSPAFGATGLRVTSAGRVHHLLTVGAEIILRDLGVLSGALQAGTDDRLRLLFGL